MSSVDPLGLAATGGAIGGQVGGYVGGVVGGVLGGLAGPEGIPVGAAAGRAAGRAAGAAAGSAIQDACTSCPPCSPYPAGTPGYQGPKVSQQGVDKGVPHYILFEVQQIPSTCQCIWKENTKGLAGGHHADSPLGIDLNGLPRPPPYPGR